jgi:putative sigma-54 modulation protein
MHIQLSCHHTTLTDGLRQAVESRFDRLAHHSSAPTSATVILTAGRSKEPHRAEATLLVNGKPMHASAKAPDMYAAIDQLASRLDRMARKDKTARLSVRALPLPSAI